MTIALPRLSAVPSPVQTGWERLSLQLRLANCATRFYHYHRQGRVNGRNQRPFEDLASICESALKTSLPTAFEHNPRVIGSVKKLEDGLDAVMVRGRTDPRLEQEITTAITSILSCYRASLPKAPVDSRVGIMVSLRGFGLGRDIEDEVCSALDLLAGLGYSHSAKSFEIRLKDLQREVVLGAVSELRVIYRLGQLPEKYEIVDVNCQLNQRTLEFFDLVVRDKQTGRLVLIETKKGGSYGMRKFLEQFLGLGRPRINGHATCQIDALRYPERYSVLMTKSYAGDLKSGNFEIWVASEEGFDPAEFDSQLTAASGIAISLVLNYLIRYRLHIQSMQTFQEADLVRAKEEIRQMIDNTPLEQTAIKFKTLYSIR